MGIDQILLRMWVLIAKMVCKKIHIVVQIEYSKMSAEKLAVIFAPVLLHKYYTEGDGTTTVTVKRILMIAIERALTSIRRLIVGAKQLKQVDSVVLMDNRVGSMCTVVD